MAVGWKLVRDRNEGWCRAHGVSGQWRVSADPRRALHRKMFEEAAEYFEHHDPAELFDLLDAIQALAVLPGPRSDMGVLLHAVGVLIGTGPSSSLHDLQEAVEDLISEADPDGKAAREHRAKVAELGAFGQFIEWTPVPAESVQPGA
jgi:predicted house-cleaning noncanonical NTP pyrophosphatase (MazG superfamily)